ncbi:MAG: hypothetical protein IKY96_05915, partial [Oscillospiraceae bacterium]|nr:hypothetical protein [Oscillospiraceae bacterium]
MKQIALLNRLIDREIKGGGAMDVLYLFHRYRDDVYRLAVNYTRSPQEAEDV